MEWTKDWHKFMQDGSLQDLMQKVTNDELGEFVLYYYMDSLMRTFKGEDRHTLISLEEALKNANRINVIYRVMIERIKREEELNPFFEVLSVKAWNLVIKEIITRIETQKMDESINSQLNDST